MKTLALGKIGKLEEKTEWKVFNLEVNVKALDAGSLEAITPSKASILFMPSISDLQLAAHSI